MRALLLTLPLLTLAACNSSPSVSADNASLEEVAAKVKESGAASSIRMNPGEWVTEAKLEEMEIPGMPPQAAEQMKAMMSRQVSGHKYCLTAAQAEKPDADFFSGAKTGCTYDHFEMAGGKVSGTMRCSQGGASQTVVFDGQYSPDSYQMHMNSTVEGGPQGSMKMAMSMNSKRVGDCAPGEAGAAN